MAAPQCMSNDGKAAVFVGTFLVEGDAVALCEDCLPAFCISVAAGVNGIPPEVLASVVEQLADDDDSTEVVEPSEMAAPAAGSTPPMSDTDPTAGEHARSGEITTAHGAPSDQPPAAAPADEDKAAGDQAGEQDESPPATGDSERVTAG